MLSKVLAAALAVSAVSAQTFTSCDPTKEDCKPDPAVGAAGVNIDFTKGLDTTIIHELDGSKDKITFDPNNGAVYTIKTEDDAPTAQTNSYMFFGEFSVEARAAKGAGIVTSIVLQSDDLDEIDWEWVGGDLARVQTNYFSKGCNATYDRGAFSPVDDPVDKFHTYTIKWTPKQLDWIIDGNVVRTLVNQGLSGCAGYPQSPMRIRLGSWVGGKKSNPPGTIEWAGGLVNWADAPFTGAYKNVKVVDYMGGNGAKSAKEYVYGDRSGSWQSIKVVPGDGSSGNSDDTSSSSSTATTLTKAPSSTPASNATMTSSTPTQTKAGTSSTSSSTSTSTNAAGQVVLSLGNAALVGAGILGALAL